MAFKKGAKVEACQRGGAITPNYTPGVIARVLKDETYDIDYEDGAKEKAVPAQRVRAAESATAEAMAERENAQDFAGAASGAAGSLADAADAALSPLESKEAMKGFSSKRGIPSVAEQSAVAQDPSHVGSDAQAFLAGGAEGMKRAMGPVAAKKWAAPIAGAAYAFKPKEVAALVSKAAGVVQSAYKTVFLKIGRDFAQIMGVIFGNFKVRARDADNILLSRRANPRARVRFPRGIRSRRAPRAARRALRRAELRGQLLRLDLHAREL